MVRAAWGRQRPALRGQGEDVAPAPTCGPQGMMRCERPGLQTVEEMEGGSGDVLTGLLTQQGGNSPLPSDPGS